MFITGRIHYGQLIFLFDLMLYILVNTKQPWSCLDITSNFVGLLRFTQHWDEMTSQALHSGFADLKSSYFYENLPVQTKMAILSRRSILLANFLLYDQFKRLTQINLCCNIQFMSTQQHAYKISNCWLFLVWFCLRHCDTLGKFQRKTFTWI